MFHCWWYRADYSVAAAALQLREMVGDNVDGSSPRLRVQVISGSQDRLCGGGSEAALVDALQLQASGGGAGGVCSSALCAGHLVPFEKPLEWRAEVLSFLNAK